jgi:7,8-dihydro-6-hydroxymethylpterin-pyrophosphokinase
MTFNTRLTTNPFQNALSLELGVKEVAKQLRQIKLDNGRTPDSQKFSARILDLDLILYDDLILNDGQLQIPRNEIERYAFVLEPLAEIAPALKHPVSHLSYAELWEKFDKTNLKQKRETPFTRTAGPNSLARILVMATNPALAMLFTG